MKIAVYAGLLANPAPVQSVTLPSLSWTSITVPGSALLPASSDWRSTRTLPEPLSVAPEKRMSSPAFVAAAFASDGLLPTSCGTVHWSVDFSAPA